jgi:hypothetical protein
MVSRAQERGVAIFIVVMVLTMLTAIGVFAIRAASMATMASGYDRQNTQNHFASEYGMLAATTELNSTRSNGYVKRLLLGSDTCFSNRGRAVSDGGAPLPCYHLYAADIQRNVAIPLFAPAGSSPLTPGSLGPRPLDGDFDVEITDPGPVGILVPGDDLGKTKSKYLQVTMTSTGQVRPSADGGAADPAACAAAGNETGRAFVVIGPTE